MRTTIEFVRHAKAHSRSSWWGSDDRQRPLTPRGVAQAEALVKDLLAPNEHAPLTAVYSSPFLRCVQTVEPVAAAAGLPVLGREEVAELATVPVHDNGDPWVLAAWLGGRGVALLDALAMAHQGGRVVVCSHGDVIPATLAQLVARDNLSHEDVSCKKAARYRLVFDTDPDVVHKDLSEDGFTPQSRCVELSYHHPPE